MAMRWWLWPRASPQFIDMGKDRRRRDARAVAQRFNNGKSAAIWLTVIFATWGLVILAASRVMSL